MKFTQEQLQLNQEWFAWRHTLVRVLLRWTIVIVVMAILAASYYAWVAGDLYLIPIYLLFLIPLAAALLWRKASYYFQSGVIANLMLAAALLNFITEGRGSPGRIFLLAYIFAITLFYGARAGRAAIALAVVIMAGFGWAFSTGLIKHYTEVNSQLAAGWMSNTAIILLLGVFIVNALGYIIGSLAQQLRRSQALNAELTAAQAGLEQQVAERTRAAEMARAEAELANARLQQQLWQMTGLTALNEQLRGEPDVATLAQRFLQQVCRYLEAPVAALFVNADGVLRLRGAYAYAPPAAATAFALGAGLVGQAAQERRPLTLTDIPPDYLPVVSGLGSGAPRQILALPLMYEGQVVGVAELGLLVPLTPEQMAFALQAAETGAVALVTAQARAQITALLAETQQQTAALRVQEEELRAMNEELQAQAESVQRRAGKG